jgi:hypothetical protein
MLRNVAKFKLEVTEPTFHKAVLPGAGSFAAAQGYLHSLTQLLVFVAQIFGTLVRVENGWRWMFAQGV